MWAVLSNYDSQLSLNIEHITVLLLKHTEEHFILQKWEEYCPL